MIIRGLSIGYCPPTEHAQQNGTYGGWSTQCNRLSGMAITMRLRPVPPMLRGIVLAAIRACDGTGYFPGGSCRSCGGTLSGYDTRIKRFAILRDEDGDHPVEVHIHRAYCRSCGTITIPEDPFYPGTRAGSPVVDLCRAFADTMPYNQVATKLNQMGVVVDRWSVRSYCRIPHTQPSTIAAFGLKIPVSIISLSSLAGTLREAGYASGDDVLAACLYPSRVGTTDRRA